MNRHRTLLLVCTLVCPTAGCLVPVPTIPLNAPGFGHEYRVVDEHGKPVRSGMILFNSKYDSTTRTVYPVFHAFPIEAGKAPIPVKAVIQTEVVPVPLIIPLALFFKSMNPKETELWVIAPGYMTHPYPQRFDGLSPPPEFIKMFSADTLNEVIYLSTVHREGLQELHRSRWTVQDDPDAAELIRLHDAESYMYQRLQQLGLGPDLFDKSGDCDPNQTFSQYLEPYLKRIASIPPERSPVVASGPANDPRIYDFIDDCPLPNRDVAELVVQLQETRVESRRKASAALGILGKAATPATTQLVSALHDADTEVRCNAVWALGRIRSDPAIVVPALVEALRDSSWQVRWRAAAALGDQVPDSKSAAPALTTALSDPNYAVRCFAAETLGRIGSASLDAIESLIGITDDEDTFVRLNAVEALGLIDAKDARSTQALQAALQDQDFYVRNMAARFIR